jgi:hypothetical protein
MTYKVVPFTASIANADNATAGAAQLESLIESHAGGGWEYVRLEHVDTVVAGSSGCFGIGATPSQSTSIAMAVFRK